MQNPVYTTKAAAAKALGAVREHRGGPGGWIYGRGGRTICQGWHAYAIYATQEGLLRKGRRGLLDHFEVVLAEPVRSHGGAA